MGHKLPKDYPLLDDSEVYMMEVEYFYGGPPFDCSQPVSYIGNCIQTGDVINWFLANDYQCIGGYGMGCHWGNVAQRIVTLEVFEP